MSGYLKDDMGEDDMDVGDDSDVGSGAAEELAREEESMAASAEDAESAAHQRSTRLPFISTAASASMSAATHQGPSLPWSPPVWSQPESRQRSDWRSSFGQLPEVNRWFLGSGTALLCLALMLAAGPPLANSMQAAVHPYTAAGKQETCASHLHSIALALAAYAGDNDGRFPPLDYQNAQRQRATWVSLVRERPEALAETGSFECPLGPRLPRGQEQLLSSYVLNPVLATAKAAEMDDAAATLMLADGGKQHDVSLLPPYPTWPSFGARKPDGSFDDAVCNIDFRHSGQTSVAYADGHADVLSPGAWSIDANTWGGSAVLRRARTRIAGGSPQAQELVRRLQSGDVRGAASYLTAHRTALKPVTQKLVDLWRYNTGEHTSDSVEEIGWHLARAWQQAGDASWQTQLNTLETQRCQEELQRTTSGSWEARTGESGYSYQAPSVWVSSEERDGRYKRTFVRSSLREVFVLLESGERSAYSTGRPVDWHGMEKDLRDRYGSSGYRRLRMTSGTLLGSPAGLWEYEVEKPASPRLRKLYIGYVEGWKSHVVACTAPAKDWALWQPAFEQMIKAVESR